jgi:hypothetical protein
LVDEQCFIALNRVGIATLDSTEVVKSHEIWGRDAVRGSGGSMDERRGRVLSLAVLKDLATDDLGFMVTRDEHVLSALKREIADSDSPIRRYQHGDVLEFVTHLLKRAQSEGGQVYPALYEL